MTAPERVDADHLRKWIGKTEAAEDVVTPSLVARFRATMGLPGHDVAEGSPTPRLIHFCLCQPAVPMAALGQDGHPARGDFLPPVPLPQRMWAGSAIDFAGDLRVGDLVRRQSRIAEVAVKEGRTGALCFVTIEHEIRVDETTRITERQTIVYRASTDSARQASGAAPAPAPAAPPGQRIERIAPSPPLLFRYSALTFNSHRIHYDLPYATGEEGYSGLVVHGPLQATLLFHFAARGRDGRAPDRFDFRAISPLFDQDVVELHAGAFVDAAIALWTCRPGGAIAMQATARWT